MDKTIIVELIKAAGAIIVALIGKVSWDAVWSFVRRRRYNIPEIMGTRWAAEWRFDDGKLYVSDTVTFKKWTKKSQFQGYGEARHDNKEYKYPIEGEVSPRGIVVLKYKAEKYPTEANIGTATLELSSNAEKLVGYWAGRASIQQNDEIVYKVRTGKVSMQKIKDLNT